MSPPAMISDQFRTLIVQPTSLCNLDCAYCYLPDRRRESLMPVTVARSLAASIVEQDSPHPVEVVWHGGEPLATPVEHMLALLAAFEPLRSNEKVIHSVQTNATLINPRWIDLLQCYGFRVGISIDGPQARNLLRVDWAGRPSFTRAMKGIDRLQAAAIPFMAICVVTAETIAHVDELMTFFTELGCDTVGFNIEEQEGLNVDRQQVTVNQAQQFWRRLWHLRSVGSQVTVRDLDRLRHFLHDARRDRLRPAAPYDPIPTVAANGNTVLLSPELLGVAAADYADFVIGNVTTTSLPQMLAQSTGVRYVAEFNEALRSCAATCEFWDFCHGGQAGNRFFEHGTFTTTETAYCRNSKQALVRAALDHITPRTGVT